MKTYGPVPEWIYILSRIGAAGINLSVTETRDIAHSPTQSNQHEKLIYQTSFFARPECDIHVGFNTNEYPDKYIKEITHSDLYQHEKLIYQISFFVRHFLLHCHLLTRTVDLNALLGRETLSHRKPGPGPGPHPGLGPGPGRGNIIS